MSFRRLRSVVVGEAGIWLALGLAFVAALTSFIAAAGPRELTGYQDGAIRIALGQVQPVDRTIVLNDGWLPESDVQGTTLTPATQNLLGSLFGANLTAPIVAPTQASRVYVSGPLLQLPAVGTPPQLILLKPPVLQLSADSALEADTRLVAGTWPTSTGRLPGTTAAARRTLVLQVALTEAIASKFRLRPGTLLPLEPIGTRRVVLRVTGIVKPKPGALLTDSPAVQSGVTVEGNSNGQWYLIGALVGPGELQAIQSVWPGLQIFGDWYYPISLRNLNLAGIGQLSAKITQVVTSTDASHAADKTMFHFAAPPTTSSQLPAALIAVRHQVIAANGIDELIFVGLFAACLLLMLLCAGLAADRYAPELALMRARGGSRRQVALRTLARAMWVSGPGIAVGIAVGAHVGAPAADEWLLPAVNGAFAIAAVPVRCSWRVRSNGSWQASQRPEAAAGPRRSARRVVAEICVLTIAAGAVFALRQRGVAGGTNQLGTATPVLVAIVASILIARLYPIPVRGMLPLASRRPGAVSFLGLSQAGRAGLGAILPGLALVLTLTIAAFGVMLDQSVSTGQLASTWAKSGADAVFTAPGDDVITAAAQHAVDTVPGVKHTTLVFVDTNTFNNNDIIIPTAGSPVSLGVGIVDPASYAALAKDTLWPSFPAAALARGPGPVPVLVSTDAAASQPGLAPGSEQTLSAYGTRVKVVVAGTIGATAAFPSGGPFIIMPEWAVATLPFVRGPDELLVTGPELSVRRLKAVAAAHLRDDGLLLRSTLVKAEQDSAAQYAVRLFSLGSWAAAALSVVALIFGLGATARTRHTLRTRLTAMGMSARQARALALFDPVALLAVAVLGMAAAVSLLSVISRQIIPLNSLTSSPALVPVSLSVTAVAIPAASVIVLALIAISAEHLFATRSESARALRREEAV